MKNLLFLGLVAAATASVKVIDCSAGTSVFKVDALSFAPDTPIGGQNGTLHSVYEVPAEYNAGVARYSCALNGLPVYDEAFDICTQTQCPITAGTHDDYSTSEVPSVSGKVVCKILWTDVSDNTLLCIQTTMMLASEKKTLRGQRFHYHTHNIKKQDTCPVIEDYDPSYLDHELIENNTMSEYDKRAKKALIVLRSSMKYLDN